MRIRTRRAAQSAPTPAIVDHHVHPERLPREWLRRRIVWQRISEAIGATVHQAQIRSGDGATLAASTPNRNVAAILPKLCRETDDPDEFRRQIYDIAALVEHLMTGRAGTALM